MCKLSGIPLAKLLSCAHFMPGWSLKVLYIIISTKNTRNLIDLKREREREERMIHPIRGTGLEKI